MKFIINEINTCIIFTRIKLYKFDDDYTNVNFKLYICKLKIETIY